MFWKKKPPNRTISDFDLLAFAGRVLEAKGIVADKSDVDDHFEHILQGFRSWMDRHPDDDIERMKQEFTEAYAPLFSRISGQDELIFLTSLLAENGLDTSGEKGKKLIKQLVPALHV